MNPLEGEIFYSIFTRALAHLKIASQPWSALDQAAQTAFNEAAEEYYRQRIGSLAGAVAAYDWKAELQKYGRHTPNCPASGPCVCGFEAVERELGV